MNEPPYHPGESILVVDDTPASLRLLAQMLAAQGYQVRPAPSGDLAIAAAQAQAPDLILLDIRMPRMDGYEVCAHLKADTRTRDVPVIFISALDEIHDKMQAFASGGVDYITKPYQMEEVLARVQAHLTLRRLQRQLQETNNRMRQELTLAGEVQASLLPAKLSPPPGWQLAATLRPARETSGDFYDVITMSDGRLAILVADVVDKGVKAALFMALCWALIRTYAQEYPSAPEQALAEVNRRLLSDTRSNQFVSLFLALLDPCTGELCYCNAGHNPPLLLKSDPGSEVQMLTKTGMLVGVLEETQWGKESVTLEAGDMLVLHSDGAIDALDEGGESFGEGRLQAIIKARQGKPAQDVCDGIMHALQDFMDTAPQFDDIALMVLSREAQEEGKGST